MNIFSFQLFEILFFLMFCLVFTIFIVVIIAGLSQWNRNNAAPRLTVPAQVVAKRTDTSHHHHGTNHHVSTFHHYYVTFQVESGDRMELSLPGQEFGQLVAGDRGMLTFQGTRYLRFERSFP